MHPSFYLKMRTLTTCATREEGKCLTEEHEVLTRFTEYCSDLHESNGDTTILNGPYDTNDDKSPILREEVAVKYLKGGKSPGDDNMFSLTLRKRLTMACCPMDDHETI